MTDDEAAVENFISHEKEARTGKLIFHKQRIGALPESLADLKWLTQLKFDESPVTSLSVVRSLTNLKRISFNYSRVSDLTPLTGLPELLEVSLCHTPVRDLGPLAQIPHLEEIYCDYVDILEDALFLCDHPNLRRLSFQPGTTGGLGTVPRELLSEYSDNCLERVRAYYRSAAKGTIPVNSAKLFIYGNGEIGKTQLARQLDPPTTGPAYDPTVKSTHGVQVRRFDLEDETEENGAPLALQLWDFGGQDLYHGAHSLFLKDRAIHVVAWTPETEVGQRRDVYGYLSTNQPLAYWLNFARGVQSEQSALIVVQTQADLPGDEKKWSENEVRELSKGFGKFKRFIATSAKTGRGIDELRTAVLDAGRWLNTNFGRARISTEWAAVASQLERLRAEDALRTSDARLHRTLSLEQFEQIACDCGAAEDVETLLYYLNAAGLTFWNNKLFTGRLILDQAWALDAIYAVFDRSACITRLRDNRGRFTASDLGRWLWNDQGHSVADQSLFIQFMISCRICFVYQRGGPEVVYVAPDALPPFEVVEQTLGLSWDQSWPTKEATYEYDVLHDGLLRCVMASIGAEAGLAATYWRDGLQLYDIASRARLRLTQTKRDNWAGSITIAVQAPTDSEDSFPDWLAGRVGDCLEKEERRCGIKLRGARPKFRRSDPILLTDGTSRTTEAGLDPRSQRGFFISYAWGDDTPDGIRRAKIVDDFCAEATRRGIHVNVDKAQLRVSDSITSYMDRLAQGDRIFVFLSDRYLHSDNCMSELVSAWRYSRADWTEFSHRVKFYLLPCAKIFGKQDRANLKSRWFTAWSTLKSKHESVDPAIMAKLGSPEKKEIDTLAAIFSNAHEIVSEIADHLLEPNFETFCSTWLTDLEQRNL